MISNSIRPLIFHILFTTAIGNVTIKILQINLSNGFNDLRDSLKCDTSYIRNNSDVVDFIKSNKPNVIILVNDCRAGYDSFIKKIKISKLNVVILPIFSYDKYDDCYDYPRNNTHTNCYYSFDFDNSKLTFLILNTRLWIKESIYSEEQLIWLRDKLQKAELKDRNVIIAGYNSPGSLEISNGSLNYAQKYNEKLVELFVQYSNTIKGCLFGNQNIDTFRIISNKESKPMLTIFIAPLSSNEYIRQYTYNQTTYGFDNYFVFRKESGQWKETYNCKTVFGLTNMNASGMSSLAQSFLYNDTRNFNTYFHYLLKNNFEKYCRSGNNFHKTNCRKCRSYCFIIHLTKSSLDRCLVKCRDQDAGNDDSEQNNGFLFVFVVIAGFVIILVGIVLAVNKVYCIRRGRQRNLFLAPLTLNIQADVVEDIPNPVVNGKLSDSKDDVDNSQMKISSGFRRNMHDVEQTYNYIRM